jgi:asparagine synthase (glutamine-hydrolysing)
MCGISGIISFNKESEPWLSRINQINDTLSSRGPDNGNVFISENLALGHRRLAIIDTSAGGNQPMSDESGRYTIVFNGEFFNYREHRDRLAIQGYQFKTTSDTEVLLALFSEKGKDCLNLINGFFAFAIYDKIKNTVLLVRDRFGIKPLFIYRDSGKTIFSSEMKGIIASGIEKTPDRISILNYLQLNYNF